MAKFLGFGFFIMMFIAGFWGILFLSHIALAWLPLGPAELYGPLNKKSKPEDIKRKPLNEQENIEVLYKAS